MALPLCGAAHFGAAHFGAAPLTAPGVDPVCWTAKGAARSRIRFQPWRTLSVRNLFGIADRFIAFIVSSLSYFFAVVKLFDKKGLCFSTIISFSAC